MFFFFQLKILKVEIHVCVRTKITAFAPNAVFLHAKEMGVSNNDFSIRIRVPSQKFFV